MISWMQKHHKYMVWTIWVAAIGFIGAGSVGWGSLHFGSKATSIAKVGDIEISQQQLNQAYSNLYEQYAKVFQNNFDEKKAKELGLIQQAFSSLEIQTKLLNFAKDNGIIVTDKEVATYLYQIKSFQKNGQFDKTVYNTYLKNRRLKAKFFEASLKRDLTIKKVLNLFDIKSMPLEMETIASSVNIFDKLQYKIVSTDDLNITVDDNKLKTYWQNHKEQYQTDTTYTLSILWENPQELNISDSELQEYYNNNNFNFTDDNGNVLTFENAKKDVKTKLELKAAKKAAQLKYIALKKGKIAQPKPVTISLNDSLIPQNIWQEIETKNPSELLKPKVIDNKYAIIRIIKRNEPQIKSFEMAKDEATKDYLTELQYKTLHQTAENILQKSQNSDYLTTDFVNINSINSFSKLNPQESLHFLQNLFSSNKEKGIIELSKSKIIVYKITDQKIGMLDKDVKNIKLSADNIKTKVFQTNFIQHLDAKYQTEVFMKGLRK